MKIKLSEVLNMKAVVEKLIVQDVQVSVAFDLMKITKTFEVELELYNQARTKLFKKYGEENKETKTTTIQKDKVEIFQKEMQKLYDKEVKLEIKKIKLSELGDVKLTTIDLIRIEKLIEK